MKKYEPKQLVAISRYQNYFPSLPEESREDVYARISELIEEEKPIATRATTSTWRRSSHGVSEGTAE